MSDQARKYSFEDKGYIWSSSNETGFLVWLYWFWNSFQKTNSKKKLFAKINAWPQKQITLKRRAFIFRLFSFKAPDFKHHSNYLIPKTCISPWTHYLSPYTYLSSFPNVPINDTTIYLQGQAQNFEVFLFLPALPSPCLLFFLHKSTMFSFHITPPLSYWNTLQPFSTTGYPTKLPEPFSLFSSNDFQQKYHHLQDQIYVLQPSLQSLPLILPHYHTLINLTNHISVLLIISKNHTFHLCILLTVPFCLTQLTYCTHFCF